MSQVDELKSIKLKIFALSQKTVDMGCSEFEAMAAMKKVGQLLAQYNLTMSEIDIRDEKCVTRVFKYPKPQNSRQVSRILLSIADFCDIRIWTNLHFSRRRLETGFTMFGHETDCQMAEYLYTVIDAAVESETKIFKKSPAYRISAGKTSSTSFQSGMISRISHRLRTMKEEMTKEQESNATGTALIVLKGSLVEEEFKNLGLKLKQHVKQKMNINGLCFNHGTSAGDRVNLSRPIGGPVNVAGLL
jgi:hypothetical protein